MNTKEAIVGRLVVKGYVERLGSQLFTGKVVLVAIILH